MDGYSVENTKGVNSATKNIGGTDDTVLCSRRSSAGLGGLYSNSGSSSRTSAGVRGLYSNNTTNINDSSSSPVVSMNTLDEETVRNTSLNRGVARNPSETSTIESYTMNTGNYNYSYNYNHSVNSSSVPSLVSSHGSMVSGDGSYTSRSQIMVIERDEHGVIQDVRRVGNRNYIPDNFRREEQYSPRDSYSTSSGYYSSNGSLSSGDRYYAPEELHVSMYARSETSGNNRNSSSSRTNGSNGG